MPTKFQFSSFLCLGDTGGHFDPTPLLVFDHTKKHVADLRVGMVNDFRKYSNVLELLYI